MSEEQAGYKAGEQPAAIIESPRTVRALQDGGLVDYQVWGWVKTSAKFRKHIKVLRGAKHAIWHWLALSVDENGKCKETIKQICEGTGYSHTEVIDSLKELDVMGYLSIQRDTKGNIYNPQFVARGAGMPSEEPVKKLESTPADSTPAYQVDSSPSEAESVPTSNRVKELIPKKAIQGIEAAMMQGRTVTESDLPTWQNREKSATDAFESAFGITRPWSWYPAKTSEEAIWREFRKYLVELFEIDKDCFTKYFTWATQPFSRGAMSALGIKRNPQDFPDSWSAFCASAEKELPEQSNHRSERLERNI